MKQEKLKKVLAALPATEDAITTATGISRESVRRYVMELRKEKCLHIGGWRPAPGKGPSAPILHVGDGVDAPFIYRSKKELRARVKKYREIAKAKKLEALMRGEVLKRIPVVTTVQHAMRTQPVSIFAMASYAQ